MWSPLQCTPSWLGSCTASRSPWCYVARQVRGWRPGGGDRNIGTNSLRNIQSSCPRGTKRSVLRRCRHFETRSRTTWRPEMMQQSSTEECKVDYVQLQSDGDSGEIFSPRPDNIHKRSKNCAISELCGWNEKKLSGFWCFEMQDDNLFFIAIDYIELFYSWLCHMTTDSSTDSHIIYIYTTYITGLKASTIAD